MNIPSSCIRITLLSSCLAILGLLGCGRDVDSSVALTTHSSSPTDDWTGRYQLSEEVVLSVRTVGGRLGVLPSFWRTEIVLETDPESTDPGAFRSLLHPDMKFRFSGTGSEAALQAEGHREIHGRAPRMGPDETLPVEILMAGQGADAFDALVADGLESPEQAIEIAQKHIGYFPTRTEVSVAFATRLAETFPSHADALATLGVALVQGGQRAEALEVFLRAESIDSDNEIVGMALRILAPDRSESSSAVANPGWELPFSLDELFAPPSTEEIARVREQWRGRDLRPRQVVAEWSTSIELQSIRYDTQILSHSVHGDRHYGAILVPQGVCRNQTCPVVVDIRGVSWDFQPRDINGGIPAIDILRDEAQATIFVVPALRGEVLEVNGRSFHSAGDRRNGWDGAADDVIALLSVVLEETPTANPERVCLVGKSRGGSVALLAAARDPRVQCVVGWSGPADWFTTMGNYGWSLQELVEEGLHQRWKPGEGWGSAGQFIERHLEDPITKGVPPLGAVRFSMLASSPLHFLETLPAADLHYGAQDGSVGITNPYALRDRLRSLPADAPRHVTIHPRAGHDMPWPAAYDASRDFLHHYLD